MKKQITYAAVDVDDKSYHLSIFDVDTGEILSFKCRPTSKYLLKKIKANVEDIKQVKICYESTYLGFSLCRELRASGLDCEVIASSLIPDMKGKKVKTDRLDSEKLVVFYSKGLLTPVKLPSKELEQARDLLRSRGFLISEARSIKRHILSICRREGWDYKQESDWEKSSYWTTNHQCWLRSKIHNSNQAILKFNIGHLLKSLEQLLDRIELYDLEIDRLSKTEEYEKKVGALKSFRGIKTTTAMILITEIGDVNRFAHPSKLSSYCGLDIVEFSSGGTERKAGISKMGNPYLRTSIVEASQTATRPPQISRRLKTDREGQSQEIIMIADKCMHRLYKKGSRLKYKNKQANKVKVACAREMLGFVWNALKEVS